MRYGNISVRVPYFLLWKTFIDFSKDDITLLLTLNNPHCAPLPKPTLTTLNLTLTKSHDASCILKQGIEQGKDNAHMPLSVYCLCVFMIINRSTDTIL